MTNRSRLPPSQRPMISSVRPGVARSPPSGYASAVSKKSIPPSAALSMTANAVASSLCSPKVIVPRQSRDTFSPFRPSLTCSIAPHATAITARRAGQRPSAPAERDLIFAPPMSAFWPSR